MQIKLNIFFLIYFITALSALNSCIQTTRTDLPFVKPIRQNANSPSNNNPIAQSDNQNNSPEELIWKGNYKDIEYKWSTKDLYIKTGAGKQEKLLSYYVKKTFADRVSKENLKRCVRYFDFKVLSIVGSIISIENDAASGCYYADHIEELITLDIYKQGEFYSSSNDAIDLRKSGRAARLTDFFTKQEIFQALMELPEIQRTLKFADRYIEPSNLQELLMDIETVGVDGIDGSGHKLTELSWSSFAFVKLSNEKVLVDIELQASSSATSHPRLRLMLPIPKKLKDELKLASIKQSGFLSDDIKAISKQKTTKIVVEF